MSQYNIRLEVGCDVCRDSDRKVVVVGVDVLSGHMVLEHHCVVVGHVLNLGVEITGRKDLNALGPLQLG